MGRTVVTRSAAVRNSKPKELLGEDLPGTCTSVRWRVAMCSFFALFFSQTFRLNFVIGLSCMVDSASDLIDGRGKNVTGSLVPGVGNGGLSNMPLIGNQTTKGGNSTSGQNDDFDWSKKTQRTLLSAYFYGYIISQIPGGWLSRRYGSRRVMGFAMIVAMICTALTPICARTHLYLLFALRVVLGAAQGMGYPAVFNLTGRWIPPLETTRFVAITSAGYPIGHVFTFIISSLLCKFGFDDGWGSIFYVFDFVGLFWILAWFYTVYDTPLQHPRISEAEKEYIISRVGKFESEKEKRQATPWCSILRSPPVWGTAMAYFAAEWVNCTIRVGLVLYMRQILHYHIASSGIMAVLPFLVFFFSSIMVGFLADFVLEKATMTTANTRRLFQAISFVPLGMLLGGMGFVTRDNAGLVVGFLILSQLLFGLSRAGYLVSIMDFAPRFAGEICGMMNVIATIPSLSVPLVIGALTPNHTHSQWRNVFLIGGGVALSGTIGFCILARGEIQAWAEFKPEVAPETELMIDGKSPNSEENSSENINRVIS